MSVMSKGIIPDKQKEFIFFLNIVQKEKKIEHLVLLIQLSSSRLWVYMKIEFNDSYCIGENSWKQSRKGVVSFLSSVTDFCFAFSFFSFCQSHRFLKWSMKHFNYLRRKGWNICKTWRVYLGYPLQKKIKLLKGVIFILLKSVLQWHQSPDFNGVTYVKKSI